MLSYRISYLRKQRHISQAALAEILGISPSTEGMYEQGRRTPSLDTLITMARIFDVSLDYLITGAEFVPSGNDKQQLPDDCPCSSCYWKEYRGL